MEEYGYVIESNSGIIQHGTYTDSEERSKELFCDLIAYTSGEPADWEEMEEIGFRAIPVKIVRLDPEQE